jgi:signal transduction histidine kinase
LQLASEVLRRTKAEARAAIAQHAIAENGCHATLGRYVLEMRHTLNNCLTSVLGNAELLLLEPGALTSLAREQVETIHMMAMRINEILQRLSSLELELQFAQKESHSETRLVSQRAAAGD